MFKLLKCIRPVANTSRCFSSTRLSRAVAVESVDAQADGQVHINWSDGHTSQFSSAWLRDHCPISVHPTSGQRETDSVTVGHTTPELVEADNDRGTLTVQWTPHVFQLVSAPMQESTPQQHTSVFALSWLRDNCYQLAAREERRVRRQTERRLWDASEIDMSAISITSDLMMSSREARVEAHRLLHENGLLVVTNMPQTVEGTRQVASLFGVIRRTFYGDDIWDTAPKDSSAVNDTAYSNVELKPHTDCTYFRDPPGLQFFNCVEQSAVGGYTWLVDGFKVADHLRNNYPEVFDFFSTHSIPYQSTEQGVRILAQGPGNVTTR